MRIAQPAGFTGVNLRSYEIELIYALAANQNLAEAIDLAKQHPSEPRLAIELCLRFLLEGENELVLLRDGLQVAARLGFVNLFDRARGVMARICAAALANDIEPVFVRQVIELKQLKPPPLAGHPGRGRCASLRSAVFGSTFKENAIGRLTRLRTSRSSC